MATRRHTHTHILWTRQSGENTHVSETVIPIPCATSLIHFGSGIHLFAPHFLQKGSDCCCLMIDRFRCVSRCVSTDGSSSIPPKKSTGLSSKNAFAIKKRIFAFSHMIIACVCESYTKGWRLTHQQRSPSSRPLPVSPTRSCAIILQQKMLIPISQSAFECELVLCDTRKLD